MTYGYPTPKIPKTKPDIWLCKPDLKRTAIHKIVDSYGENYVNKFSAINEFNFTIPSLVERNHKLIQNPLVKKIRERYLIRTKDENGKVEYFMILKINKQMDSDGFESITYNCYSLGIQLANRLIRDVEEVSKNLSYLANLILETTTWSLDYVDADFDLKYRSFEVSSANALQCIFDLAERFNAGIVFNTVTKKISFFKPQNIGNNKGLRFKEGFYLESFGLAINPEDMVTRLKAYGQDGLEFRRLSPTGSNYIEDFSFFIYPFEADSNYNVIKKSEYWSDELCIAYLKYKKKLESVQGQFDSLTTQSTTKTEMIQTNEQQLSVLITERNVILNERDVINDTYGENAPSKPDWQDVIARLNAKLSEITAKESQITTLKSELESLQSQIQALRVSVQVENNFTAEQIEEWDYYIIDREYYNDSIIDEKDLLEQSIEVFEDVRQPPLDLTLSIDNFLFSVDPNFYKDKLSIGDTLKLKSKDLAVDVSAKIIELNFNYDSGDVQVTVSNTNRENDDFANFIEQLNLASNTSTTVNIDKYKWNTAEETKNELSDYINNALDSAKQLIQGGLNNSVTLSERGLIARDLTDPEKTWLMIQNGQLFITNNGGNSVQVAISKNGVIAERLAGKIILSNKLYIEDTAGVVTIQNAVMTVYDLNKKARVEVGRYLNPSNPSEYKYGLNIKDGQFDIRTTDAPNRGVQIDGIGIRTFNNNSVRTFNVEAATGMVEIVGSLSIRTSTNTNRGVVIDGNGIKGYNASGQVKFEINSQTGDAWFGGRLESATGSLDRVSGTVDNLGGTFAGTLNGVDGVFTGSLSAATGTFEGLVTGTLSAQTVSAITISADQITALRITADMLEVNELSAITANLGTVNAGTLNGVSLNTQQDITVGNNIYMANSSSASKSIIFGGSARIVGDFTSIDLSAPIIRIGERTIFDGTVDFTGVNVIGLK